MHTKDTVSSISPAATANAAGDSRTLYTKVALRVLPILVASYFFAYLDRVNVGLAKLQMLDDLKLSEAAYGFGAGIFFLGYLLFEVPSNMLMVKIGAKKTLCRIMILWGFISMGFAFVQTPTQFYVLRFLLGVAEAGFYPGIILYLTFWFPSNVRARMTALFYTAVPISGVLGGPVSGLILESMKHTGGLAGWQWLFLLEGAPSVLIGLSLPWLLNNKPSEARWLSASEKDAIAADLAAENDRKMAAVNGDTSLMATIKNLRVWHLVLICLGQSFLIYGISFWLPTIIKDLGISNPLNLGLVTAIPYAAGAIALNVVGRSSDRKLERRWHTALPFLCAAVGLALSVPLKSSPTACIVALTFATASAYAAATMFWTLPSLFLAGMGMAAAIGLINSLGGLGGFFSPYIVGVIKTSTGSTEGGVLFIAAIAVIAGLLALALPRKLSNQ
ncbi:major facilitator transporter [Caballeronia glebae]|uniref:Major facilitator transporter n=1 Tax=Caballeronia glebae TaxID=1777143 RepID=A0A158AZL7_9BURK|nr:MFS transporter [Caballeronia glebae]SAK63274.1 major facilitator transporter [Caballeronia glebae]